MSTDKPTARGLHLRMTVNGADHEVAVPPHHTLLETLRETLGFTGTKHGCELGECGACTVRIDGEAVLSCLTLSADCDGRDIQTVEGLAGAQLHPLQQAFADCGAAQCGYCTPGVLMSASQLLDENNSPTRDEIKSALAGNLCRCTGYLKIFEAVEVAAARCRGEAAGPTEEQLYGH